MPNITQIPASRIPITDANTGYISREWYMFFINLFNLTGAGSNPTSLSDLQMGPEFHDSSGEFQILYDQSQLAALLNQVQSALLAIQGNLGTEPSPPQLGTISSVNLTSSITPGGVIYGTSTSLAVNSAGSSGQFLTSQGASAPTWTTPTLYEKSTFTPGITFGGAAVGITYSTQTGNYTRIGDTVNFTLTIVLTSKGSSTGTLRITSLPYTCSAVDYAVSIIATGMQATVTTMMMGQVFASSTTILLYKFAAGSVTNVTDANLTGTDTIKITGHYDV